MGDINLSIHRGRAEQLANAMELCHDDMPHYSAAVGLLAVHSAISYNDAIQIKLTGKRAKSQDHQRAATATEAACRRARMDTPGVRHLKNLLRVKTHVS